MDLPAVQIKAHASGHWLSIIKSLAPELARAAEKPGRHVSCPIHGGRDGFRLFKDVNQTGGGICNSCGSRSDGFSLLMWANGWTFPETLDAVAGYMGVSPANTDKPAAKTKTRAQGDGQQVRKHNARLRALYKKLWQETLPISHQDAEPVRRYLQHRGLDEDIPDWPSLRFHPAMQYRDEEGKVIGYYPAMLALLEQNERAVTIHRTYLTDDGRKAPVEFPKKLMQAPSDRSIVGSAIRLGNPGRVLCVAEGIETALAVTEATGMVTWSLVSSTIMPGFIVPAGVEKLIIWSDLDRPSPVTGLCPGQEAAKKLAECAHTQSLDVVICEPPGHIQSNNKSLDWLDILNREGPNAFRIKL